ncbi:MAG: carbohydrate-binding domain-containing protein [Flavihumibacter sp.]
MANSLSPFALLAIAASLLTACSKDDAETTESSSADAVSITSAYSSGTAVGSTETAYNEDDILANSAFTDTVLIQYGAATTVTNPLSGEGVSVTVSGDDVVVDATAAGVAYQVQGSASNGSLKLYSEKKFALVLNGLTLSNDDGPAINIQSTKRAFVVLAANTSNSLSDGANYTVSDTEDQKATFFSEGQLIFSGTGSLTVAGNYKHAICSDDYIRVVEGDISISKAATDGFHTNEAFIADGGTISVTAASDGIECEEGYIVINDGQFVMNTGDDGMAASYEGTDEAIVPYVVINGGSIEVNSTEGEGIEAKNALTINGGTIKTITADDGLNAGTAININAGTIYCRSTDNDAIDSNGEMTITGGLVLAVGARQPEAGFDCDTRTFTITGGLVVGIGGATSSPTASVSKVPSLIMGGGTSGQLLHIRSADGTEALTFEAPVSYSTLLLAGSKLKQGDTYTIYSGGTVESGETFYGLYTGGTYSGGTAGSSFTISTTVTVIGGSVSRG